MSKIEEPVKMNVAAQKISKLVKLLNLSQGTPAVYVVDTALGELISRLEKEAP